MGLPIFLSWSGKLSQEVATAIHKWLPSVLQAVEPFLSAEDIGKGERWSDQIATKLEASGFGIIVLTPENIVAPWVLFEAGALSKMVGKSHVAPFLINMQVSQVRAPLNQFQATRFDKGDVFKLVKAVNSCTPDPVKDEVIEITFGALWPLLEKEIVNVVSKHNAPGDNSKKPVVTLESLGLSIGDLIKSVQNVQDDVRRTRSQRTPASGAVLRDLKKVVDIIQENRDEDEDIVIVGADAKFVSTRTRAIFNFLAKTSTDVQVKPVAATDEETTGPNSEE